MSVSLTEALASIRLFSSLPSTALEVIAQFTKIRPMRVGETIFCQGEPSPYCFGVLSGEICLQRVFSDGQAPKILNYCQSGELFGESALYESRIRTAMASASKDGQLLAIAGREFRSWIVQAPALSQPFLLALQKNPSEKQTL